MRKKHIEIEPAEVEVRLDRMWETVEYERAQQRRGVAEIERLMSLHLPDVHYAQDRLRPGNHGDVTFVCTECRVQWPCRAFNDFGKIYTALTGFEASVYEPLVLVEKKSRTHAEFVGDIETCSGCEPRRVCDPS